MRIERRITISTIRANDEVIMEFYESEGRTWKSMYHLWLDSDKLITVRIIALMSAWIEHDDANFEHPGLTMSDV